MSTSAQPSPQQGKGDEFTESPNYQVRTVYFDDYLAPLSDPRHTAFIKDLGASLEEVGFFALSGLPLEKGVLAQAYEYAEKLFSLPLEVKERYSYPDFGYQVGYVGVGKEQAKDAQSYDLKEFWHVSRTAVNCAADPGKWQQSFGGSLEKRSLWPSELPGWPRCLEEVYRGLERCAVALLEASALYLGLEKDRFSKTVKATDAPTLLRVLHYPPLDPSHHYPGGAIRAAAHEDINLITLLCAPTAEGLELKKDGRWYKVVVSGESQVIVGSGDMLQNITNGRFPSMTHRVVNPPEKRLESSRYSMPFFVHPHPQTDLTPLPALIGDGQESRYPMITAGEYLTQRLREIGLA